MFAHLRKPNFERLQKTLLGKQADAIPLIELGIHPIIKEAILKRPVATIQDDIEFMGMMGYDFIKIQPIIKFQLNRQTAQAPDSSSSYKNAPDRAWASEHEGVITSWEDLENYTWPQINDIDYSRFEQARKLVPEGMGIIGQYGDIFTMVWEMLGFETFAVKIYEEPELVDCLFDKVSTLILSMFENMAQMECVGALWFSDDIAYSTGMMVSPDFLRSHFFPLLKKIGQWASKRNLPLIYHTDGLLWDVMNDIIDCGVTALHPIEPKAMDINTVKKLTMGKLALCGNIDVDLLARGTPDQISALVKKRIEEVGPGGGYALGSSNSIPDYVKLENYIAMVKTALETGKYQ